MTKHGIRFYSPKDQRRIRRQNHIARDLRQPKYHQRIVETKKAEWGFDDEEYE